MCVCVYVCVCVFFYVCVFIQLKNNSFCLLCCVHTTQDKYHRLLGARARVDVETILVCKHHARSRTKFYLKTGEYKWHFQVIKIYFLLMACEFLTPVASLFVVNKGHISFC